MIARGMVGVDWIGRGRSLESMRLPCNLLNAWYAFHSTTKRKHRVPINLVLNIRTIAQGPACEIRREYLLFHFLNLREGTQELFCNR